MSDSQSMITSLLEVMTASKTEGVFVQDSSNLTLQTIFQAEWASMNVGSKSPISCSNSRHAAVWRLYLHCQIEDSGIPCIICIIGHQVLCHPSEHVSGSIGKHFLPKALMAKLNKLTQSEVSELTCTTVDQSTLAILNSQGSRGITMVSSQTNSIFDSLILHILTQLADRML